MKCSSTRVPTTQQQAAGLLCAAGMTLALLFCTSALTTASAAPSLLNVATHPMVTAA